MQHQPLIASYAKDFAWLFHFLTSFRIHATGFLPPVIVVPGPDVLHARKIVSQSLPAAVVRAYDVPKQYQGLVWAPFMRAQLAMLSGDVHCPDADVVWLWGSDCFIIGPLRPEDQMEGGKPVMSYSTYENLGQTHPACLVWRAGTTKALGWGPESEFMRRLPLLYPRDLYPAVRNHVAKSPEYAAFEEYVYGAGQSKNFSESNVLGAYAWRYFHDRYEWFQVDGLEYSRFATRFPTKTVQFWSHGGLDRPNASDHVFKGRSARAVMDEYYAQWRRDGIA